MLKRNDLVKVFQCPWTDDNFEGEAVLCRRLDGDQEPLERWMVMFPEDQRVGHMVERWVHERNLVKT